MGRVADSEALFLPTAASGGRRHLSQPLLATGNKTSGKWPRPLTGPHSCWFPGLGRGQVLSGWSGAVSANRNRSCQAGGSSREGSRGVCWLSEGGPGAWGTQGPQQRRWVKQQKAGPSYSHTSVLEVAQDCSCWLSPLLPKLEATRAPLRREQTRTQVRPHEGMLQSTKEK